MSRYEQQTRQAMRDARLLALSYQLRAQANPARAAHFQELQRLAQLRASRLLAALYR